MFFGKGGICCCAVAFQWGQINIRRFHSETGEMLFLIRNPPSLLRRRSLTVAARFCDMLQAMQQTAATASSPASPSFAGLLAALAAPAPQRAPAWSDDGLADDYATLSYERALRAHARYRSVDASVNESLAESDFSLTQPADSEPSRIREAFSDAAPPAGPTATLRAATRQAASPSIADFQPETTHGLPTALDRNLKSASITIRLSKVECAQLRKRAAEAGLTVSAYLRSCTFEAESLRALVKDTLAQLRSDPGKGDQPTAHQTAASQAVSRPIRCSWRQWWERFWPHAHASRRIVQA